MARLIKTEELDSLTDVELVQKRHELLAHYRKIAKGKNGMTRPMWDANINYGTVLTAMLNRGMQVTDEMWKLSLEEDEKR